MCGWRFPSRFRLGPFRMRMVWLMGISFRLIDYPVSLLLPPLWTIWSVCQAWGEVLTFDCLGRSFIGKFELSRKEPDTVGECIRPPEPRSGTSELVPVAGLRATRRD